MDYFKKKYSDSGALSIALLAGLEMRLERMRQRRRAEDNLVTIDHFRYLEEVEEMDMQSLLSCSDMVLSRHGRTESPYMQELLKRDMDLKGKIKEYLRILQVARKPSREEFTTSAKVTSLGLFVVGIIGFIVFLLFIGLCGILGICL